MVKDFTEDDLEGEENSKNEWEYKVRSSPRKASVKDSAIDPNNPYVNNNLDADLGMVIGARRANRKQIDTQQFLLGNDATGKHGKEDGRDGEDERQEVDEIAEEEAADQ